MTRIIVVLLFLCSTAEAQVSYQFIPPRVRDSLYNALKGRFTDAPHAIQMIEDEYNMMRLQGDTLYSVTEAWIVNRKLLARVDSLEAQLKSAIMAATARAQDSFRVTPSKNKWIRNIPDDSLRIYRLSSEYIYQSRVEARLDSLEAKLNRAHIVVKYKTVLRPRLMPDGRDHNMPEDSIWYEISFDPEE